jgi:hypothetical protein
MKKVFKLTDAKHAPARQVDAVKHEINKYVARERKKKLTEGVDFWDFDCKFGDDSESAVTVHVSEISKLIDSQVVKGHETFYLEILAKAGRRIPKNRAT